MADSAAPSKAKVWDPNTGFGGNGTNASGFLKQCVRDGPFKNLRPAYWNTDYNPHCLVRLWLPSPEAGLQEMAGYNYGPDDIEWLNSETVYSSYNGAMESGPHSSVHIGVGQQDGDLGANNASPNGMFPFHLHFVRNILRSEILC